VIRPDPAIYEDPALHPASIARLGRIGALRDQRYVEVHLAPVRYDGATRSVRIEPALEFTVSFPGGEVTAEPAPADPVFEPVYRDAFVNYGQGRSFRATTSGAGAGLAPAEPVATGGLPRRRIVVRQDGVVRLDHAYFSANAPEFLAHDPAKWKLTSRGQQVPLRIRQAGAQPTVLEPGEWIQFYGQRLDEEPKQVLSVDHGGVQDIYAARDFSDENVYFLTVETASQPAMTTRDATPTGASPAAHFPWTAHVEADDYFEPLPGGDVWYWAP
jgi:hypothetical protein